MRYDARGVPHLQAQSEADLYRALGYVHAQDRLFQMEIMRRLARGELAEVLGDKLLPTDTLFRTACSMLNSEEEARVALVPAEQAHAATSYGYKFSLLANGTNKSAAKKKVRTGAVFKIFWISVIKPPSQT